MKGVLKERQAKTRRVKGKEDEAGRGKRKHGAKQVGKG